MKEKVNQDNDKGVETQPLNTGEGTGDVTQYESDDSRKGSQANAPSDLFHGLFDALLNGTAALGDLKECTSDDKGILERRKT